MKHNFRQMLTMDYTNIGTFSTMEYDYLKISALSYVDINIQVEWNVEEPHTAYTTTAEGTIDIKLDGSHTVVPHSYTKFTEGHSVDANNYKFLVIPIEGEICKIHIYTTDFANDKMTILNLMFSKSSPKLHND